MQLPSPRDLKTTFCLNEEQREFIKKSRKTVKDILDRKDPRLLVITGPCSIHQVEEALEFARCLKSLLKEVSSSIFLVMRAYVEKPRTKTGWRGFLHDPHLDGTHDLLSGLKQTRSFLLELAKMQVPAATEFLTPTLAPYMEDLITWGCIGARTCSSQIHRLLASHLPMPVGFKNTTGGNIECALHGALVASEPQALVHVDEEGKMCLIQSKGNPDTHLVLRGSASSSNYDEVSLHYALNALRKLEIPPRFLIDCSHGNAQGDYLKQKEAFCSILSQIQKGNRHIIGMMLESHLREGAQKLPQDLKKLQKGISITDPCLNFSSTEELIYLAEEALNVSFPSLFSSSKQMTLNQN